MSKLYTAHAKSKAGRGGNVKTDDGKLNFDLSPPGGSGSGTNPEQLFACGYAACFGSAVASVAKSENLDTGEVTVESSVDLNKNEEDGYFLSVQLVVTLPNLDNAQAQKIVEKAHQVCPYSKATRGNIEVKLSANGQSLAAEAA